MRFNKGTEITTKGSLYKCICADDEIAVFGSLDVTKDESIIEKITNYKNLFVVSQDENDAFNFEYVE